MFNILLFGDIYGKPGRAGLKQVLPEWRRTYAPELVVANVENLAHGRGVSLSTMAELVDLGVDAFTSGNHVFHNEKAAEECFAKYPQFIRPYNYGENFSGRGFYRLRKNSREYLLINLNGQVFFENQFRGSISSPFTTFDELCVRESRQGDIILVDLHADATSEKVAFGWYADGRATAVVGTHTHVPTADSWIMPGGTAFTADLGMTGPLHSVIGVKKENVLGRFLDPAGRYPMEPAEAGPVVVNALVLTLSEHGRVTEQQRLQSVVSP